MTLAELQELDVPVMWASLTVEQRADIGAAALAQELAHLVSEDDGTDTTRDDRQAAEGMAAEAGAYLTAAIEDALPAIPWWNA